tara:strand:+ start:203 stop:325 length:123 start_codon:yes stop_codon:yes gene_type:complete
MLDAFLSDDESSEDRSRENVMYNKSETSNVDAAFEELLAR